MNHQSSNAYLEHSNLTVKDPKAAAATLCQLFGWNIRWQGPAKDGGFTVHVGSDDSYLALYTHDTVGEQSSDYLSIGTLNHLGIVVDDLDAVETTIKSEGFKTFNHSEYHPGRRFYFMLNDWLEIEVISYQSNGACARKPGPSTQDWQYRYQYK